MPTYRFQLTASTRGFAYGFADIEASDPEAAAQLLRIAHHAGTLEVEFDMYGDDLEVEGNWEPSSDDDPELIDDDPVADAIPDPIILPNPVAPAFPPSPRPAF
jgi:hypothetical protein